MLRPVNKLSPEIISRISQYVPDEDATDARSIIPLTHVCRYWRWSIISAPRNWTSISSYTTGLATLSLERSKAAPLQLWLDTDSVRQDPEFRDLIKPYIQNIETLQFEKLTAIEDLTQTLPNFPQSTPNLRSLRLSHKVTELEWDPSIDPFVLFPSTLRSLSMSEIPLYPSFLGLGTLTTLSLHYYEVCPPLDTVLDVLEGNRLLESVDLQIAFDEPPAWTSHFDESPVWTSQHRTVALNRLQCLSITFRDQPIVRALISSIPLRRGAHLVITFDAEGPDLMLNGILTGMPFANLPNLLSPTFVEYRSYPPLMRVIGPNGSFSYHSDWIPFNVIEELLVYNFAKVKKLHLYPATTDSYEAIHPTFFPTLETLAIEGDADTDMLHLFSTLFPEPSFFPSLKTLGFLDCDITEEFMEELTRFASDRKKTASAWLHRILFVHRDGEFPSGTSIHKLRRIVTIVDVRMDDKFPKDLVWRGVRRLAVPQVVRNVYT